MEGFKNGGQIPAYGNEKQYKKLTQSVFLGQPKEVDWCGVDYDGLTSFGIKINPRYTWASERWRGFTLIGVPEKTEYERLTSITRVVDKCKKCSTDLFSNVGDDLCAECWSS